MERPNRRKRTRSKAIATAAGIDRISTLPDSLLCHILSFLPTKTSVTTALLSRRWRELWKHVQVFYFDLSSFQHFQNAHWRFIVFVNAALIERRARDISKLRLRYVPDSNFAEAAVTTWVSAAIGPHLEELKLLLHCNDTPQSRVVVPPRVFANCTALVTLSICGNGFTLELPQASSVRLPSLKALNLTMEIDNLDKIHEILSGCPVLETLNIGIRTRFRVGATKVSAPKVRIGSLKRLEFECMGDLDIVELEIDTPSLEYLSLTTWTYRAHYPISVCDLPNLVESRLRFEPMHRYASGPVPFLPMLLRSLCRARLLALHPSTMMSLLYFGVKDLPEFRCLLNLKLHFPWFGTSFLVKMLEECHVLQVLTVRKGKDATRRWTEPTDVPNCLTSHLSKVYFSMYDVSGDDKEFIAYILKNGLVLKTVTIQMAYGPVKRRGIHEELSLLPKISENCMLKFI